jgi:hypothetical protein
METIPRRKEAKLKTNEDAPTETPEAEEAAEESGDDNVDDEKGR